MYKKEKKSLISTRDDILDTMLHIHVDHMLKWEIAKPTYTRHYRRSISRNVSKHIMISINVFSLIKIFKLSFFISRHKWSNFSISYLFLSWNKFHEQERRYHGDHSKDGDTKGENYRHHVLLAMVVLFYILKKNIVAGGVLIGGMGTVWDVLIDLRLRGYPTYLYFYGLFHRRWFSDVSQSRRIRCILMRNGCHILKGTFFGRCFLRWII